MGSFRQLRLLLWKNGLGVIRQPGWSLTLVLWPIIIFIILAVTRHQFPAVMRDPCYVGPRNLPSSGFFPFLQTLMCNTDSTCHNKSRLSNLDKSSSTHKRSHIAPTGPPVAAMLEQIDLVRSALLLDSAGDQRGLLDLWEKILTSPHQGRPNNTAQTSSVNDTVLGDQLQQEVLDSMSLLKRSLCTVGLSMVNKTSDDPLAFAIITFCKSNDSLLEVSLLTLNQMLMDLMLHDPSMALSAIGEVVMIFDQLQNQSSLWDTLLGVPWLFSPTSVDHALDSVEALLTNLQGAVGVVEVGLPEAGATITAMRPLLTAGIHLIHYAQKWPGRDVYITLGDVVTLQNATLSNVVKGVLQEVQIPLNKAFGLALDRAMVRSCICNSTSLLLTTACATGTVDALLGWISPEKVAKQILLAWSKDVALGDVAFARGLLHSLMGGSFPRGRGGINNTRSRRNAQDPQQGVDEELFLHLGHVVIDILRSFPEVDMVVQTVLRGGFTTMQAANLALDSVEEITDGILNDASYLQKTFLTLLTNQSGANSWIGRALGSAVEMVMMILTPKGPLTCEGLVGPFKWILPSESVDPEMWMALICQNTSDLQQILTRDWAPLMMKVQEIYSTVPGQSDRNVTLPMILSEWHKLSNHSLHFAALLDRIAAELGANYWMAWMQENSTYDMTGMLKQRVFLALASLGEKTEKSGQWPQVMSYFHMASWILNYRPGNATQPANCSVDANTLGIHCDTGLNWTQFVHATAHTLMSLPDNPEILISCLKGTVNLLQHLYGDMVKQPLSSFFQQQIPNGNALSAYLTNLMNNLWGFAQKITTLNDTYISSPNLILPRIYSLLQSTNLTPLMPLSHSNGTLNVSTVLGVAMQLGRMNQHLFTFNETDPLLPNLESLVMQFLSMEGNLTFPVSLSIGHTQLTYSGYLRPEDLARLREAIRLYSNQTSAGFTEAALSAIELLKKIIDTPDGSLTGVVLGYIHQLQEFLVSALRLRRIDQVWLPSGQWSPAQVTDLHLATMDLLKLVTSEGLQNLTQAGPSNAQQAVIKKMLAFLPVEVQMRASNLLQDLQMLLAQMSFCTLPDQNCVANVSDIFRFLEQIVEMMLNAKGNVTIQLAPTNPFLRSQKSLDMSTTLFSFLLSQRDAAYIHLLNKTLYFIGRVMATPNITVSDIHNALRQSNLTLAELNNITALAGAANLNDLMVNIVGIVNIHQCFELQNTPVVTVDCALRLISGVSKFLSQLPAFHNETAVLSLIPAIVNKTILDIKHVNFTSHPHLPAVQILKSILTNIKMSLQLIHLNSPEIMNEFNVLEGLLVLASNKQPFDNINTTLLENPQYAQKFSMEITQRYLKKLENITASSPFSIILYYIYRQAEMQVALQLASADFGLFVSNQIENLTKNLHYPVDGMGVSKIGQTIIAIISQNIECIKMNMEILNTYLQSVAEEHLFNKTILYVFEHQIGQNLDLARDWMRKPNVISVFNNMLQWGNYSMNTSSPGADLHHLLKNLNLTVSELDDISSLVGAANLNDLMRNIVGIINVPQCFEPQNTPVVTADCALGLMRGVSQFLSQLPALHNETAILSLIPAFLNETVLGSQHINFTSHPHLPAIQILKSVLTNIKMSLQLIHLNSPEIMNELNVLEGLLVLASNTQPFDNIKTTLLENPQYAQKFSMEIAQWYLKKLENITASSPFSNILYYIYRQAEMQVSIQLASADFGLFVSNQIENLTKNLHYPVDGMGVSKIGQTTFVMLRHLMKLIKVNLEIQNDYAQSFGVDPMFNTTILCALEDQIGQYLDSIKNWMSKPSVVSIFNNMLHWGNSSMNTSTPVADLHRLLQTVAPFFSEEQQAYLAAIGNITKTISKAVAVAEQPGGLQSDHFLGAMLEVVQSSMETLSAATGPLPLPVQQDVLAVTHDSLRLILHPEMSYASSRNVSLHILRRAERIVRQTMPEMVAQYFLYGIQMINTYFETVSFLPGGQDKWNEIILNEMKTVQGLLPLNSTARAFISVFINITHLILESSQGNMSLFTSVGNSPLGNMTTISSQILHVLWPIIMGDPGWPMTASSLQSFADLAPVLEQILTGRADPGTWDKLEHMLQALLSTLRGTPAWEDIPAVSMAIVEVTGTVVNTMHAKNAVLQSLQTPLLALVAEVAKSANGSRFNSSDALGRQLQLAIERTVQDATQVGPHLEANGTLECNSLLKAWEPVREVAGLSRASMAVWCNISLQPAIATHTAALNVYANGNMSHAGVELAAVNATAGRIVGTLRSLYQVNINCTHVSRALIMAISTQFSTLELQPPSPEVQAEWHQRFLDMQLLQSLASIQMLSDRLLPMATSFHVYTESLDRALSHLLSNLQLLQNPDFTHHVFSEAAMIFLSSANISGGAVSPVMWENFSWLDAEALVGVLREVVKVVIHAKVFGDVPTVYQTLNHFVASNSTRLFAMKVAELVAWWSSTRASEVDLLTQVLPRMYEAFRAFLSTLDQMGLDLSATTELIEDIVGNLLATLRQMVSTSDLPEPTHNQPPWGFRPPGNHHNVTTQWRDPGVRVRRRREAPPPPIRMPLDDFLDLFYIDYPALFKALSVPPSPSELMETAHMFFANPDLSVVMKGVTRDMSWGLNASKGETIDTVLGALTYLTHPEHDPSQLLSVEVLKMLADVLPPGLPFSEVVKNVTGGLARESRENQILLWRVAHTAAELLNTSVTDRRFWGIFDRLAAQVCVLERTESLRHLMRALYMEPGQLCGTILPSLQVLAQSLMSNGLELSGDALLQTFVGEPNTYRIDTNWTSVFSQGFGLNASSLSALNINITSPVVVRVGELLRNKTAFTLDVHRHLTFDPHTLQLLLNTSLPNSNLVILSWLVNLRHCSHSKLPKANQTEEVIYRTFCSMSAQQWFSFLLLMARHVNTEQLIYRMVLSEDLQSVVGVMLQMTKFLTGMMGRLAPAISQLQDFLLSIQNLNLVADPEFRNVVRGYKTRMSSRSTLTTLSRAMCNKGILALFGIAKLSSVSESDPSLPSHHRREEMIEQFKIPRNATPFCMNLYLDMVNTTGGAIAWAFLKPMLMGQVLFTPDTPLTRDIMEKSNKTLQEFANLKTYSEDWIQSSDYIMKLARLLRDTLPLLQNSLGNAFVKNFIEMQTDINVGHMKESLSNFSNMTVMLEKNKHVLRQITTLSNLMVNISSCVKFDRFRGFGSADELNGAAQHLAKNRDLYAGVIFKLPEGESSSSSSSSTTSLPPKVRYTIRMHMDNVMRTDRTRNPYYVKDTHVSARQTLRYNRGFVYLQDSIDRAIIETQAGRVVAEPAVQLQPFPYPCFLRDEYLEAISFVFPLMMMIAWVLFVADFVKKLVHERELRLHEYMKMMGVDPLSHFLAWFLECAGLLVLTIAILTLVLKCGGVLPKSDGFLLFIFFCDYGLSIMAISFLVSSFFDKTYIAGLSGSLVYVLCFFPFIIVMGLEASLSFSQKSALGLLAPTCFSYASQYISRYESQGDGIQWSNSYSSPIAGDTVSFGWLCWLLLIDSGLYFLVGAYVRMVFPGKYGIPSPWYFPLLPSFWADLCCRGGRGPGKVSRGLLFTNLMQRSQPAFSDDSLKGKGHNTFSSSPGDGEFSGLPVGVALHGLTKTYGKHVALENLNVSFYEGHVTALLGHNGAGKTTTMSLLTGLFAPSSGTIEVYGLDMQANLDSVREELGVCMQYDVHFDHMTTKEHLLLYGRIKAPHWTQGQLHEQVRKILEETGMYAHRHKRVGTLSGGMKRKLSISIAFIGGSRLVVLDEPTTGVDPCSRRSIWDIVMQHKMDRTIIMSTHHLDEAEVLSDRIAFLERGGLKCCGSPFQLKDKLSQGYKLTLTRKIQSLEHGESFDAAELKVFIQAHVPDARLKEAQGSDLVFSLPRFTSANASSYRSLLTALDANLDALQLGCYGISDTTLEEVFLQLTQGDPNAAGADCPLSISESVADTASIDSFSEDLNGSTPSFGDKIQLTGSSSVRGVALVWQQAWAMLVKRFHHSRRDWKGLISQVLLPVLFVVFAMGLGSIKNDLQHYPEMELSPALYNVGPSNSFFSNSNSNSSHLVDAMMSFPGIDNVCLDKPDSPYVKSIHAYRFCVRTAQTHAWRWTGDKSQSLGTCKCTRQEQVCSGDKSQPPHGRIPSSQMVYNLSGVNVENYLMATANDFVRNRYGGFVFGKPLPPNLQMDLRDVPANRTLAKVWYNPEGHHTMPAYLNSLNNIILRANLPADKEPGKYAISVSSHPYFGRADNEDAIVHGMIQILVALCVLTGYAIMTASFAIYEVQEHHSGSKRLQHISGVGESLYWAVNFLYDMILYLIPVALTVAVVAAFQIPAFTDRQNLAAVSLLLVLFGFATFPWMYLLAGVFKDAEMAFISYVCINLFITINTILSTSILYFLGQIAPTSGEAIQEIFGRLSHAFLIFPQFSFGNGLMELARVNMEVQILSGYGVDAYKNPFSTDALGWMFLASFLQGVFFFSLRLLLNRGLIRRVRHLIPGRKLAPTGAVGDEDRDVAAEHQRVSGGKAGSDVLQVNSLTKVYRHLNRKVHAVNRLSVGIPAGECFGLLGVNGAGKTTTFKMLTGDVSPTNGTAQIKDTDGQLVDIMECRDQGINIGYCPQVDALDDLLTGEEHLYFYARLRGISKGDIDRVVNYLLKKLELGYHRRSVVDGYSCGTRRKLSTALALVGRPQILLLDEPSSGMDPRTKRHLWKIISEEVKGKCAVVLTSHSMEECEALCSRLAIMVKGQFRCLGSLQHIKNRFGSGFTVKMYLAQASCDVEVITGFMQDRFPSTYLKDKHSTMVEFHVPVAPGGVAGIFHQLESNKQALQIKHFSVSQTTLDEVFINFAMGKVGEEDRPIHHHGEDPGGLDSTEALRT